MVQIRLTADQVAQLTSTSEDVEFVDADGSRILLQTRRGRLPDPSFDIEMSDRDAAIALAEPGGKFLADFWKEVGRDDGE